MSSKKVSFIRKKFRRPLQDVRVKVGASVASDHHLLWPIEAQVKGKLDNLERQTNLDEFNVTLSNKFQAFHELLKEETIDER